MPVRMNQEQVVHLHSVLSTVCTKGEDGYANYTEGQDDSTVLIEVNKSNLTGREYVLKHVAGLRLSMFGKLRGVTQASFDAKLSELENRIAHLEEWIKLRDRKYVPPTGRPPSTPPE